MEKKSQVPIYVLSYFIDDTTTMCQKSIDPGTTVSFSTCQNTLTHEF